MKLSLIALSLMMVGCLKPVPPAPEVPRVIVVKRVGVVKGIVISEVVDVQVDEGPPAKTWMLADEVDEYYRAKERAERWGICDCDSGAPICECVE